MPENGIALENNKIDAENSSLVLIILQYSRNDEIVKHSDNISVSVRKRRNGVVSRNISMILENLLKQYESSQLPSHGRDKPTSIKTNILIRSMGPISELDMEYSMDCYFRQYWRDERLSFRGPIKSLSLSIKMLERIWRPDTFFYNGKNSYVHTVTVPNKLLRISQDGDILYSMRLTIKAKCPMKLHTFPMDRQSCPLIFGSCKFLIKISNISPEIDISDAYSSKDIIYQWMDDGSVTFVPGMTLSQFDLISFPYRNQTILRREGDFSVLQVSFNLQRHTGYFLIQVYVPCILIVVLSWVSFWIHREATSDRVGLGITTVLTLSTISLDSRRDLPKVKYATALDWFLLMSFFYCIATLLEFAGVHYFTKVGSGEISVDEEEWEEFEKEEIVGVNSRAVLEHIALTNSTQPVRRRSSLVCPILNDPNSPYSSRRVSGYQIPKYTSRTMEKMTQTQLKIPKWKQLLYCLKGDDNFRKQRQRDAAFNPSDGSGGFHHVNSVSLIDRTARILFPVSFTVVNIFYWMTFFMYQDDFEWENAPSNTLN